MDHGANALSSRGPGPSLQRAGSHQLAEEIHSYPLKFSGDGGVFFGVWIVNLLLMIVTLGLYTPFARRRTVQYFYGNTLMAGSPLEFTGGLGRMVLGFLLFIGLYLVYSLAANTGQNTAVMLFMLGGFALAPLLWGSAMRFRLASTRWRGIRGRFTATRREVYRASWPVLVAAGIGAFFSTGVAAAGPGSPVRLLLGGAALIGSLLCVIRLEFNYRRLLVSGAEFGAQGGRWKPAFSDFVKIWLAAIGLFLATAAVLLGAIALAVGGSFWAMSTQLPRKGALAALLLVLLVVGLLFVLLFASGPARAYREARIFKLVWNNVGLSHIARFRCELSVRRYVLLRLKNMLLSLLTGGLYRPFAITSEYQMKTESVTLHVKGGLDQLVGQLAQRQGGVGDAIADAVGLDLVG